MPRYPAIEQFRLKVRSMAFLPLDDGEAAEQRTKLANHRHSSVLSGLAPDPEIDALNEMLLEEHANERVSLQIMQEFLQQRQGCP